MPKYRVVADNSIIESDDIDESLIPILYIPIEDEPEKAGERLKVNKSRR